MARSRTISPDFWTSESVIDCAPMTRLLFIGLWNFADDFGVQPLKPRTIRMQVFPGDTIENDSLRAMIDELAAHKLVRIYAVEGQEYLKIVDWAQIQRVGKRARRRYPAAMTADHSKPWQAPEGLPASTTAPDHSKPLQSASATDLGEERERWRAAIEVRLRRSWPDRSPPDVEELADTERWIGRWMADGCELERDVMAAVGELCQLSPYRGPPNGLSELAATVASNRSRHMPPGAHPR